MDYYIKKYSISDCFVVTKNLTPKEISRIGINPFLVVRRCKRCLEKIYTGPNCRSCGDMYHLICAKMSRTCCGKPILPATDFLIKFNCNKCDEAVQYGPQCVKCNKMFHNHCLEPFEKCCKLNIFKFQTRECRTCDKPVDIGPKCPSCGRLYHTYCIMGSFECCNVPFDDDENAYYNCSKCTTRVVTYGPMCFICGKMVHKRCMDHYHQCCGQLLEKDVYFIPHLHFDSQGRYINKGRKRLQVNPLHHSKTDVKCLEKPVSVCVNSRPENENNPSSTSNDFACLKEDLRSLLDLAAVTKEMIPLLTTVKEENTGFHITADCRAGESSISPAVNNIDSKCKTIVPVKTESLLAKLNNSMCSLEDEHYSDGHDDCPFYEERSDSDMEMDPPILQVEDIENDHDIKLNSAEPPVLLIEPQYNQEINQTKKGVLPVSKSIVKKSTVRKPATRQQPKRNLFPIKDGSKCINVVSDIVVVPGVLQPSTLKVNPAQMASKERAKRKSIKKENDHTKITKTTPQSNRNKDKIDQNSEKSVNNTPKTRGKANSKRKSQEKSSVLDNIATESVPLHIDVTPAERDNIASPSTLSAASEPVFSILNENSDDSLQNFFYYLYTIVKKFPNNAQIQTKSELFRTVIEAELKLN